jgi:HlyD family secretion protein
MAMKDQLFRKISLDRLSSPEQLDTLVQVTSARAWIALTALSGIVVAAVLWGIFGSVPTKVSGSCILIRPGGALDVVSPGSGRVVDISIESGDLVREGQVIARLDRNEASGQIRASEARLRELRAQETRLKSLLGASAREQQVSMGEMRTNLNARIQAGDDRVKALEERVKTQAKLLEDGLVTRQSLVASQMELASARQDILDRRNEITQLGVRRAENKKQVEGELSTMAIQIAETRRTLENLMRAADQTTLIYSPYSGRVLEVRIDDGDIVGAGSGILSLEQTGSNVDDLEVLLYLPPQDGKKVKVHMPVQISPGTIKKEEHGLMLGRVRKVADFPSTPQGMLRTLRNEQLVTQLSAQSAPIAIQADLTPSKDTVSGYRWTSPKGPPARVESGTLCTATVTLDSERPISLVIPAMRKLLDI